VEPTGRFELPASGLDNRCPSDRTRYGPISADPHPDLQGSRIDTIPHRCSPDRPTARSGPGDRWTAFRAVQARTAPPTFPTSAQGPEVRRRLYGAGGTMLTGGRMRVRSMGEVA
jgi:hypothetical protein